MYVELFLCCKILESSFYPSLQPLKTGTNGPMRNAIVKNKNMKLECDVAHYDYVFLCYSQHTFKKLTVRFDICYRADVWILTLWERRFRIWIILDFLINLTLI